MIAKSILLLALIAFAAGLTTSSQTDIFNSILIDVGHEDSTPAKSVFLSAAESCARSGLYTQVGNVWKVYWSTGHAMESNPSIERTDKVAVTFEEPFESIPTVAVALKGFDIDFSNAGVHVTAADITRTGFNIVVTGPVSARVYAVQAGWIATVSSKSKIWVYQHPINTKTNSDIGKLTYGSGERPLLVKFKYSRTLKNPGLACAISGFEFGPNANVRLHLEPTDTTTKGFRLQAKTWADTVWKAATATIVVFEKAEGKDSVVVKSSVTGATYSGSGERSENQATDLTATNPIIWQGLSHIDFINGHNYRLVTEATHASGKLTVNYKTWADTMNWEADNIVFYMPAIPKKVITQTGIFSKTYWATGHVFENNGNSDRTESYTIKFDTVFDETPAVAVGLQGIDINWSNAGVKVTAESVTASGFTIKVVALQSSLVYHVQISWLATVSSKSGIYVSTISRWSDSDADVKKIISGLGERSFSNTINHPAKLTNPGVALGINSFKFGANNIRLDVTADSITSDSVKVNVKTWWDSTFYGAGVTVISYEKDCSNDAVLAGTSITGPLYGGSGSRAESATAVLKFTGASTWVAFQHLDFITGHNYRFTQTATVTGTSAKLDMTSWADTQTFLVTNTIFYTYPYRY